MTWVRLDDQWDEHPKFLGVPDLAQLLWVKALTWSARRLTDGFVPAVVTTRLLSHPRTARAAAARLVSAGLWTVVEGGYQIHDFLEYQPSSERIKAHRAATRARVSRFRNGVTDGVTDGVTNAHVTTVPRTRARDPDPDPDPEIPQSPLAQDSPARSVRDTALDAYGQGIRTVVAGPAFVILPAEGDALMDAIAADPRWCGLRGELLGQAIRKSAADYARARGDDAKFERGLSPTKWIEWLRSGSKPSKQQARTSGSDVGIEPRKLTPEQESRVSKAIADRIEDQKKRQRDLPERTVTK